MKNQKPLLIITLIFIMAGIILVSNLNAQAQSGYLLFTAPQQDVANHLLDKLKQQNIPVVDIQAIGDGTVLNIVLQSASENEKFAPEDFINLHIPIREVLLASEKGYKVSAVTENLINKHGESIYWRKVSIDADVMYVKLPPSSVSENIAKDIFTQNINIYGMSVSAINISSFEGYQTISIELKASSMEEINLTFPKFITSLEPLMAKTNAQGAQVVMCKIVIKDKKGNILIEYLLDEQLRTTGWWAAEGVDVDSWIPSRPAAPPPVEQ